MGDQEPEVLVQCRPVGKHRRTEPELQLLVVYSGSTKGICSECGRAVWIGPRSLAVVEAGKGQPICDDCFSDLIEAGILPAGIILLGNPEVRR